MEFNGPDHDSTSANADAWEVNEMAAELLANREAQPVAVVISRGNLAHVTDCDLELGAKLYTAPPAPTSGVVNLPTEFISDEGVMVRLEQVMAALALVGVKYERRGDACRAAMLAAAPEGGNDHDTRR